MAKGTLFLVLVVLLYAPAAGAQPPDARITFVQEPVTEVGYVDINLGLQATSTSFASTLHPIVSAEAETVQTTYGPVRFKVARRDGRELNAAPEFDDCQALAAEHGVSIKAVQAAAIRARTGQ